MYRDIDGVNGRNHFYSDCDMMHERKGLQWWKAVSPFSTYIQQCMDSGVTPWVLGFASSRYKNDHMMLNGAAIGDSYGKSIAQHIHRYEKHEELYLQGNWLSDKGALPIISSVSNEIRLIDLG